MAIVRDVVRDMVLDVVYPIDGRDAIPNILYDGNTVAWYDSKEKVTKDGSNLVSIWADKSGSGNDLLQAGADSIKPLWSANGILFDGVSDMMKAVAFTLIQPEFIYIVLKCNSFTNFDYIFDGNANSSGFLRQGATTPSLEAYAGVVSSANNNLSIGSFGIVRVLFKDVSSTFQINETTKLSEDLGLLHMGGFTLGSRADGNQPANMQVKEIIIRKVADVAQDEADIYSYLSTKYGI